MLLARLLANSRLSAKILGSQKLYSDVWWWVGSTSLTPALLRVKCVLITY